MKFGVDHIFGVLSPVPTRPMELNRLTCLCSQKIFLQTDLHVEIVM